MKNIVKVNTLDSVYPADNTLYQFNDMYVSLVRSNNDVYGNPIYRIQLFDLQFNNVTESYKGKVGTYYKAKQFLRVQSYNISNTLENILNK